ncbi:MAG: EF-P lysine aminoacylase EpmA [Wenzhouxiangella sp.]|jgi:lysyl-tRNA synthetase class 2|nr:EF-P lysine aminoacylase EpmA [Wenzhouxiangella sp.]
MTAWRPTAGAEMLRRRAEMLHEIRVFFHERGVCEVQTPLLTRFGITDVNIDSLAVAGTGEFLRTSPEYCHKRLLASGFGDLYELGPVFRAGDSGRWHRTEFTLLEWYRIGWDWRRLALEVLDLIRRCAGMDEGETVRWLDWRDAFAALDDLDPQRCDLAELRRLCPELEGYCDRDMLLDYLLASRIQPGFPAGTLTVLHGFPASQAALARLDPTDPGRAERFEVFLGPIELANGYRELTDPAVQRGRFEADTRRRAALNHAPMPIDERLLSAMRHGLPECAGVALGVDRLLMAIEGCGDIAAVQAFADG